MTVIAWDGKTLCADRRATQNGYAFSVTKIFKIEQGLVACSGNLSASMSLMEWLKSGGNPKEMPEFQKDNDRYEFLLLIRDGRIIRYERELTPFEVDEPFTAVGSGRDYALAAMACGRTARQAVEIACLFDPMCGNGIDELAP